MGDAGLIPESGRSLEREMATYSSILVWKSQGQRSLAGSVPGTTEHLTWLSDWGCTAKELMREKTRAEGKSLTQDLRTFAFIPRAMGVIKILPAASNYVSSSSVPVTGVAGERRGAKSGHCSSFPTPQVPSGISQSITTPWISPPGSLLWTCRPVLGTPRMPCNTLHFPHPSTGHNTLEFPIYSSVALPVCKLYEGKDHTCLHLDSQCSNIVDLPIGIQ